MSENESEKLSEINNKNELDEEIEIPVVIKDENKAEDKEEKVEDKKSVEGFAQDPEDHENITKLATKIVEDKRVAELNDEEREIIIANAKAGYDQPNFDVKLFKNGKTRIVKKKNKPKSVSEKAIESNKEVVDKSSATKKTYYTQDQLLMEHVIELNAKFEKLMFKHKKLKKKYLNLRDDIYVDVEDEVPEIKEEPKVEIKEEEPKAKVEQPKQTAVQKQNMRIPATARSWRSRLTYL